jgi:hypothetical protein
MRKTHPLQGSNRHHDLITALGRRARTAALIAFGILLTIAVLNHAPAHADSSGDCLTGGWIAEAITFVAEETDIPAPEVCVRSAKPEQLRGLVLPGTVGTAPNEAVAAVYVPATREILLADDLDPGRPLARSYLVHELVHAQQFAAHAHEQVSCPGVLEGDAYDTQGLYLRTKGLHEEAFLLQVLGMFQRACGYSDY